MTDFLVTCTATGASTDADDLRAKVAKVVLMLGEFGALGRLANDGSMYEATLVVAADTDEEARRIAQSAVMMATASSGLPNWPLLVTESFVLAAA